MVTTPRRVFALLFLLALGGATTSRASGLDDLRWLEGTWKRETSRGVHYETWRILSERTFEGEAYLAGASGSATTVTESLLLVEMGGEVFYIPRPRENPYPVAFRLVEATKDSVTFENPAHDFPKKIIYARGPDGSLSASIEGPVDGQEAPQRIEYHFTRAE